ncbi:hypothetical protein [Litorihabitans aurantiacus]|uniref:Uncharacterized protein n=1 Tax=Litorihabitans aurantiacus TaxID=1930061 RepID=A0AA38CUP2_9MICO|nr:hypothetical protein [Litorihabitans aurantiacus]GMA33521.1 hypothetical protein GCM10025875_35130 [Litorihabitans aurantiacus]GMA33626.1 hypothetical protein GCM10025875_36180 [Litorihabitans aurantiacus]
MTEQTSPEPVQQINALVVHISGRPDVETTRTAAAIGRDETVGDVVDRLLQAHGTTFRGSHLEIRLTEGKKLDWATHAQD